MHSSTSDLGHISTDQNAAAAIHHEIAYIILEHQNHSKSPKLEMFEKVEFHSIKACKIFAKAQLHLSGDFHLVQNSGFRVFDDC